MTEPVEWVCPCGPVKGQKLEEAFFFRGIPYAKTERFRFPEPVRSWEGVWDGTAEELDCWQLSSFVNEENTFYCREFRSDRTFRYAESPMTLNILSPSREGKHPVLLFLHGGAFETGTIGELPYGTCTEYEKRGIVFVSIGYRLNVFALHGGENYGLMDMIAAVDWVRENIASFGGDPDNITLIGQSAGAMSLMDLLCSGKLERKITHAVMMSGAGIVPRFISSLPRSEVKDFWSQVDSEVGGDPENADPETLWRAWTKVKSNLGLIRNLRVSQPCLDGTVLKESQAESVRSGRFQDIPLMIGVTSQDYMPYFIYGMALRLGLFCSRNGHAPVYGYLFDRTLPGNSYKAFHASDLWYMFGNMDKSWRPFEETDYSLSAEMINCVASFCVSGTPGESGWLPLSEKQKGFRLFDGVSNGLIFPAACRQKMLHTLFKEPGPV